MTPDELKAIADVIGEAGGKFDARLHTMAEQQSDVLDRRIAQAGQLRLLTAGDPLHGVLEALVGATDPT